VAASLTGGENPFEGRLFVVHSAEELARAAAGRIWGIVRERAALLARGGKPALGIHVALSGGETPRRTYEVLSAEPYRARFPWERSIFTRWTSAGFPGGSQSNRLLLGDAPLPPPSESISSWTPASGRKVRAVTRALRRVPDLPGLPRFDAIVLGSKRAHSLFPAARPRGALDRGDDGEPPVPA
jgi:6-phosphogluconolactonase